MAWWDTITNALIGNAATGSSNSSGLLGSNGSLSLSSIANIATSGYDIYKGIQSQQNANRMYDLMYGTATAQDTWAAKVSTRYTDVYWPWETIQYSYASEDREVMRPSDIASRSYNIVRKYQQISQAESMNPIIDNTERNLINKLVEDTETLKYRLANDAVTAVNQSFDSTRIQDNRRLNSIGANPTSGSRLIYSRSLANAQALASATARNNAAMIAEDTAISRHGQALAYRTGVNLPTYQTTPSVQAGNVTTALSSTGSIAGAAGAQLDNSAQQSFTGAATALSSNAMQPYTEKLMSSLTDKFSK
jgi:hypothetical protein